MYLDSQTNQDLHSRAQPASASKSLTTLNENYQEHHLCAKGPNHTSCRAVSAKLQGREHPKKSQDSHPTKQPHKRIEEHHSTAMIAAMHQALASAANPKVSDNTDTKNSTKDKKRSAPLNALHFPMTTRLEQFSANLPNARCHCY